MRSNNNCPSITQTREAHEYALDRRENLVTALAPRLLPPPATRKVEMKLPHYDEQPKRPALPPFQTRNETSAATYDMIPRNTRKGLNLLPRPIRIKNICYIEGTHIARVTMEYYDARADAAATNMELQLPKGK